MRIALEARGFEPLQRQPISQYARYGADRNSMSALMVVVDALARGEPLDVGLKLLLFGGGTVGAGTTIALAEEAGSWLRGPAKDREVVVRTFRLPK